MSDKMSVQLNDAVVTEDFMRSREIFLIRTCSVRKLGISYHKNSTKLIFVLGTFSITNSSTIIRCIEKKQERQSCIIIILPYVIYSQSVYYVQCIAQVDF